jgi:photosystem II stability/assembly factor-like uncharacterized protein
VSKRRARAYRQREPVAQQGWSKSRRGPSRIAWIVAGLVVAAGAIAVAVFLLNVGPRGQTPWSRLGTTDVHSLSFVGGDVNHVLFGHHGGVLESRDGGRTWRPLATTVDAMGMNPAADGSIVVAGHEVFTASNDGGATWQPIAADLPSLDIHGFARDPLDAARMWAYLATGGLWESAVVFPLAIAPGGETRLLGIDPTGLVASDDGGRSWTAVGAPPTFPTTALAATPDGATVYAGSPEGLFRSDDGGATWSNTGFAGSPFALATSSDGSTVALVTDSTEFFRSLDRGATWPEPGS